MTKITVILVDDHQLVRRGMKLSLSSYRDIEIIDEAVNGVEGYDKVMEKRPDVIITDITMPIMSGIDLCKRLKESDSDTMSLVLTMHTDNHYITSAFEAGAKGYLTKDAPEDELHRAILKVAKGEKYLTPDIVQILANQFVENSSRPTILPLTEREKQILAKVILGQNNKQIGNELNISARTVDTHRTNVMKKVGANNAAELVRISLTNKLI